MFTYDILSSLVASSSETERKTQTLLVSFDITCNIATRGRKSAYL